MSFDVSPRMWFGIDEPWVARSAMEHVRPGAVVYDVGAHIGYTCLLYAQRVGSQGAVHAFEILPSVVEQFLAKTIRANSFSNIVMHAVGLADREASLSLPIGETLMTSQDAAVQAGQSTEQCRLVILDQYVASGALPLPDYVKIDIEKAEIDCLVGGEKVIRQSMPWMMIEFHSKDLLRQGRELLDGWGYRLVTQHRDAIDAQWIQSLDWFHESVLCIPNGED